MMLMMMNSLRLTPASYKYALTFIIFNMHDVCMYARYMYVI